MQEFSSLDMLILLHLDAVLLGTYVAKLNIVFSSFKSCPVGAIWKQGIRTGEHGWMEISGELI